MTKCCGMISSWALIKIGCFARTRYARQLSGKSIFIERRHESIPSYDDVWWWMINPELMEESTASSIVTSSEDQISGCLWCYSTNPFISVQKSLNVQISMYKKSVQKWVTKFAYYKYFKYAFYQFLHLYGQLHESLKELYRQSGLIESMRIKLHSYDFQVPLSGRILRYSF